MILIIFLFIALIAQDINVNFVTGSFLSQSDSEYVQLNVALVCLLTFGVFQFLVFVHKHFEREGGMVPLLGSGEGGCCKGVRWRIKRER